MHTYLLRLLRCHRRLELPQALAHEQNPIDQQSVGRSFDLEISEKCVGPEQRQDFIEGIVRFAIGIDVDIRGGWRKSGEGVSWTTGTSTEREKSKVPYFQGQFEVSLESREGDLGEVFGGGVGGEGILLPIRRTSVSCRKIE